MWSRCTGTWSRSKNNETHPIPYYYGSPRSQYQAAKGPTHFTAPTMKKVARLIIIVVKRVGGVHDDEIPKQAQSKQNKRGTHFTAPGVGSPNSHEFRTEAPQKTVMLYPIFITSESQRHPFYCTEVVETGTFRQRNHTACLPGSPGERKGNSF